MHDCELNVFVYVKYKFASTNLFLFVIIQLVTQVFSVLVVSLCKPVIYKLKILDGGILEY